MSKTFIVAELSANHGHNLETALVSVRAIAEAGVDAIKIQTYTADTITLDSRKEDFIVRGGHFGIIPISMISTKRLIHLGSGIKQSLMKQRNVVLYASQPHSTILQLTFLKPVVTQS